MKSDLDYFSRRATEERVAAMKAADPKVRRVHLDLAELYDERVSLLAALERVSGLDLIGAA